MNGFYGVLAGAVMAGVYAGSLWFAVRRIAGWSASLAVFWLGLASLVRVAVVSVWLFVLVRLGWETALGGFVGFVVVRAVLVAWIGG